MRKLLRKGEFHDIDASRQVHASRRTSHRIPERNTSGANRETPRSRLAGETLLRYNKGMMAASAQAAPAFDGSPVRRNGIWFFFQIIVRVVFAVWLRYRSRGADRLPAAGGGLLLSNHQSFIDPLLIGLPLRRPISFLARDDLFSVPVIGWILRHTCVMPLNREGGSSAAIRETLRRMEHGFLVGIFPEGTRSPDGALGRFKPGFAALVRRADVPIFPIGIAGAHRALGRGSRFLRPHRVCVVFGEPFPRDEIARLSERGREHELVEAVRSRIADCQEEAEAWLAKR
jgi:1-acyl-sn-glycerol-3-phosphate acyltransferase